jgi:pyrroloquinoline-quinone synthase
MSTSILSGAAPFSKPDDFPVRNEEKLMTGQFISCRDDLIDDLRSHPFLTLCRQGNASKRAMHVFLEQQALYSRHFTRFLCALMSNLRDNAQVYALAANLFEELGLDDPEAIPHSLLFQNMLADFGIRTPCDDDALPGTQVLIDRMYSECRSEDYARGLGALCLGAEALVPAVYSDILTGLKALGYTDEQCAFFHIHIACDDGHAETMQAMLESLALSDVAKIDVIEAAGKRAVEARKAFFDSIEVFAGRQLAEVY